MPNKDRQVDGLDERRKYLSLISIAAAIAFAAMIGIYPGATASSVLPFGPDLSANGWQIMTFTHRKPARFTAQGPNTLLIDADRAVAVLWRQMKPAESNPAAAQWRWRIDASVGPTDLARKGGDDRAMAVYFVFSKEGQQSGSVDLPSMMRSGQGYILTYVWGGSAPKGQFLPSPYLGEKARTIVLKSASDSIGNWVSERVDLRADYRRAFGTAAPALVAVAISSDSDDTAGRNVAAISDLVVNPPDNIERK